MVTRKGAGKVKRIKVQGLEVVVGLDVVSFDVELAEGLDVYLEGTFSFNDGELRYEIDTTDNTIPCLSYNPYTMSNFKVVESWTKKIYEMLKDINPFDDYFQVHYLTFIQNRLKNPSSNKREEDNRFVDNLEYELLKELNLYLAYANLEPISKSDMITAIKEEMIKC